MRPGCRAPGPGVLPRAKVPTLVGGGAVSAGFGGFSPKGPPGVEKTQGPALGAPGKGSPLGGRGARGPFLSWVWVGPFEFGGERGGVPSPGAFEIPVGIESPG